MCVCVCVCGGPVYVLVCANFLLKIAKVIFGMNSRETSVRDKGYEMLFEGSSELK